MLLQFPQAKRIYITVLTGMKGNFTIAEKYLLMLLKLQKHKPKNILFSSPSGGGAFFIRNVLFGLKNYYLHLVLIYISAEIL